MSVYMVYRIHVLLTVLTDLLFINKAILEKAVSDLAHVAIDVSIQYRPLTQRWRIVCIHIREQPCTQCMWTTIDQYWTNVL
jgi:hypothetical protein